MFKDWPKLNIFLALISIISTVGSITVFWFSIFEALPISPQTSVFCVSFFNIALILILYIFLKDNNKISVDHKVLLVKYAEQQQKDTETKAGYEEILKGLKESNEEKEFFLKRKIDDLNIDKYHISKIFHNIFHEYRCIVHLITSGGPIVSKKQKAEVDKSFSNYTIYYLSNLKELFDILTESPCATCIKVVMDSDNVKTYKRDPISYIDRGRADVRLPLFSIEKNTAFKVITDEELSDTWYINNNLKEDELYENSNSSWAEEYNATMVVPIMMQTRNDNGLIFDILGFICVDNKYGRFDDVCLKLLSAVGDPIYSLFALIASLQVEGDEQ